MNAIVKAPAGSLPALQMDEKELMSVLQNSLYPGAKEESIKLVVGYCRASGLDPMQKPVHLVPMSVKKAGTKDYEWRDVVMPGIGLYRTQAARSGAYAGMTEPEFGEDVTEKIANVEITYPKWCKITIKRQMPNGATVEFTALEFWKENYATAGKDTIAPNAMWKKRPYAQLAKCAEAQALRKAFPEIGAAPTAEEMEGKPLAYEGDTFDEHGNVQDKPAAAMPKSKREAEQPKTVEGEVLPPEGSAPQQQSKPAASSNGDASKVSVGQINFIKNKVKALGLDESEFAKKHGVSCLDDIGADTWAAMKNDLMERA